MSVRIIVDSTADIVPALRHRFRTVPLTATFGNEEYQDGDLRSTCLGSIIGTHADPGAYGAAFFCKE